MTLDELIARLEAATGPSRELDFWCWWWGKASHDGELPDADYVTANIKSDPGPRYTASIDAALTLVPEGWEWCAYGAGGADVWWPEGLHAQKMTYAASPAVALCIAAIRARAVAKATGA